MFYVLVFQLLFQSNKTFFCNSEIHVSLKGGLQDNYIKEKNKNFHGRWYFFHLLTIQEGRKYLSCYLLQVFILTVPIHIFSIKSFSFTQQRLQKISIVFFPSITPAFLSQKLLTSAITFTQFPWG